MTSMSPLLSSIDQYPTLIAGLRDCSNEDRADHLRSLAKADLYFLLRYLLGREDIEHPWLFERCREVQASPDGHLDLWAREHYKSTIVTFGLTIQNLLNDPDLTVGIFSHTRPIAKAFLRQIKLELERNEQLKGLFPGILWADPRTQAPKWSEDEGIVLRRVSNPKEASIEAWGLVDGQPTSKHFSVLVYDDVVTRESVTTPEMILKTTDALALSYNLGAAGGVRRFIGTRYHHADTYRTIVDRGTVTPRLYPATVDGTLNGEPVMLSREVLAEKRRDMGPYVFSAQMLQNPTADSTQGFDRKWLRYYRKSPREVRGGLTVYMLVDAASEKRKTSDYTAAWIVGLGQDRNAYVLDVVRDRLNLKERGDLVMRWHREWRPAYVRYERYGMMADIEYIKERQDRENYRFSIDEVGGQTAKNDRIRRLVPWFEQGRIWLPEQLSYIDYEQRPVDMIEVFVEDEYAAFPVPLHDDLLDSLARLVEPDLPLVWPGPESRVEKPRDRYARKVQRTSAWV